METQSAWSKFVAWLKWALPALLGLALFVVLRDPKAKPKPFTPTPPKMDKADDNAKELVVQQEEIKDQHKQIEDELVVQKPVEHGNIRDAVKHWNDNR